MSRLLRMLLSLPLLAVLAEPGIAGVRGHSSMYVAGTITTCKAGDIGNLEFGDQAVVFMPQKGEAVSVPYDSITAMDYGEHAGRRVGLAIVVAWPLLFSHKKRHYLTIYFNRDPKTADEQRELLKKDPKAAPKGDVAAFEINKQDYATDISVLQAKTGLTVQEETVAR